MAKVSGKAILYFVILGLLGAAAHADTGTIIGRVFDEDTGEELIGANVWLVGTGFGGASGLEGKFKIDNIPLGTYDIKISYMGYGGKTVTGLAIPGGDPVTLNVTLLPEAIEIPEIVIEAERIMTSDVAVLADRKKAATIRDGISSEQIAKSPDGTSGDALKRVTGLSVREDKYVYIRGTTDRYNETTLNGVRVTSARVEVDKKSFAFDQVAANQIENVVVVKTASPDLPGSFSGGMVQINTLDFPASRQLSVSIKSSRTPGISGRTFMSSHGGGTDWLGIDDGTRDLPDVETTGGDLDPIAQALPNNWTTRSRVLPANGSLNLSYGDNYRLANRDFGLLASFSYKNDYDMNNVRYNSHQPENNFEGKRYRFNVLWGGLLKMSYRLSDLHKVSLEGNFNQLAEERVVQSEGMDMHWTPKIRQSIEWEERRLSVGKLSGDHNFKIWGGTELEWKAFTSRTQSKMPDAKLVEYQYQGTDRQGNYIYGMNDNYRIWRDLDESTYGLDADVTVPVTFGKVKTGVSSNHRQRDYRVAAYFSDPFGAWDYTKLPLETIFDPENYGPGKLRFKEYGPFSGVYDAEEDVNAAYLMMDLPFDIRSQTFRLAGGARLEDAKQKVDGNTGEVTGEFEANLQDTDLLPSANLTYMLSDRTNVRLAYGQSVNRPEFRELAPVLYYDYHEQQNVIGEPDLKRAMIRNYDVRLEFFPVVGQVLAASYFYKELEDPIEVKLLTSPERAVKTWFNSPSGKNYGWELELRKSFDYSYDSGWYALPLPWNCLYAALGSSGGSLNITANYTNVKSEVEFLVKPPNSASGNPDIVATRELQGQSPWMFNITLAWEEPSLGSSFSILYNKIGRHIWAVGNTRYDADGDIGRIASQDIFEEARDVLDIAIVQNIAGGLRFRFTAKDLLSNDEVHTYRDGDSYRTVEKFAEYSLGLSYRM
jgi:hypothetical protein